MTQVRFSPEEFHPYIEGGDEASEQEVNDLDFRLEIIKEKVGTREGWELVDDGTLDTVIQLLPGYTLTDDGQIIEDLELWPAIPPETPVHIMLSSMTPTPQTITWAQFPMYFMMNYGISPGTMTMQMEVADPDGDLADAKIIGMFVRFA